MNSLATYRLGVAVDELREAHGQLQCVSAPGENQVARRARRACAQAITLTETWLWIEQHRDADAPGRDPAA